MNIDKLTIGQAKNSRLFLPHSGKRADRRLRHCALPRCRVHAGYLVDYEGRNVTLKNSRRLWYWVCAENQHSLSGVAAVGITDKSKYPM